MIFKTCEIDLSIATSHQEAAVPFITHNNQQPDDFPAGHDILLVAGGAVEQIPQATMSTIILLTDGGSNIGPNPITVAKVLKRKGIQLDINWNWRFTI